MIWFYNLPWIICRYKLLYRDSPICVGVLAYMASFPVVRSIDRLYLAMLYSLCWRVNLSPVTIFEHICIAASSRKFDALNFIVYVCVFKASPLQLSNQYQLFNVLLKDYLVKISSCNAAYNNDDDKSSCMRGPFLSVFWQFWYLVFIYSLYAHKVCSIWLANPRFIQFSLTVRLAWRNILLRVKVV